MSLAHKSYNVATHAVLVIQSIARIVKAKSRARVRADALVKIQAFFRKCIVTSRLKRENAAAIAIQRRWWCFLAFLQYQSDLIDIVIVQSIFRAKIAMGVTAKRLEAVVTLQTAARRWIAVMRAKARLAQLVAQVQLLTGSALIIQKAFRSSHARIEDRKHKAAIQIQKTWRCFSVHVDYMLAILAAMAIQRFARNFLHQLSIERAAPGIISFQALYRGYRERKSTACLLDALATIQSLFRSVLVRKELSLQHSAAITIQRIVRGILDRLDLEIQEFAATEIQKVWRGFFDREEFLFHIVMILRIQSSARRYLSSVAVTELKRKVVMETISRKISARRIQMAYRHYFNLVRLENHSIILQSFARGHLARIKAQRVKLGAIALQACVRGHAARSRRTKLEVAVCRRIARATHRARKNPGLVLGVRTKLALQELRTSKRLTEIMVAAKILETSTRLSRNCCVAFAECGAPEILYELIGTCNRSLPHIEILQYVLLTLRNVSCHHDLVGSVATSKSVEILLDLVQMFRDKSEVFQVSVILLDRVVRNNGELQKSCGRSENLKRLNHVLRKVSLSAPEGTSRSTRSSTFGRRQSVKVLQNLLCFLKD
jgi:abnormal spindle-like microcephaly-associated protein